MAALHETRRGGVHTARATLLILANALGATLPLSAQSTAARTSERAHASEQPRQWVDIRNVDLHLTDAVTIRVRSLHGQVLPTSTDRPATLDDSRSFRIRVTGGTVALTGSDLGGLLNTVVFAYPHAPLSDLKVDVERGEIVQTGTLHKVVNLRFRLAGVPSLTPDGSVRIHPSEVRVLGMNGEKILHFFGMHLHDLLDLKGAHGVSVSGDDLILNPTVILPPPQIDGRLTTIRIEGDALVQEFVRSPDDSVFGASQAVDSTVPGFIHFRGGQLRFGRLLMNNTDLRIVGAQRGAPFDLSLPQYAHQLAAGESHTLPNGSLVVYMPNYSTLKRRSDSASTAKPARQ